MREINFRAWDKENKQMIYPDTTSKQWDYFQLTLDGEICLYDTDDYGKTGLWEHDISFKKDRFILMQYTGLCYEGDYVVMDCWNGGDGIEEPNHHDIFEGVVIYDKKICRFGLQTKLCDEGQIEVGLEDSQFTTIEIIGNIHENPELIEAVGTTEKKR